MLTIEFEQTPNPDAIRVLLNRPLGEGPPRQFEAGGRTSEPLAAALLALEGVTRTMIARDFVTVIRNGPEVSWEVLRPQIAVALTDAKYHPAPLDEAGSTFAPKLNEVEEQIEEVLERYVRPYLATHGGEAVLDRFDREEGVAWVRMEGACGGCPSGALTLRRGIEQNICRWVPEVRQVKAIGDAHSSRGDPKARFRQWIEANWGQRSKAV